MNFKFKIFNIKLQRGFTLIESVVAAGVFAVAITGIVGVYLSLQRINQTSDSLQALQQNTRFVSEDITKVIRNGRVDYNSYFCVVPWFNFVCQPYVTNLYLLDQDGTRVRIHKPSGQNYLEIVKTPGGTARLTGKEVNVLNFRVYVWPPQDPNSSSYDEQPTVTVFLELESNVNPRNRIKMPFQITAAVRDYSQ